MKKRVIEIDDGNLVRDDCQGGYAQTNPVCPAYQSQTERPAEDPYRPEAVS